LAPTVITGPFLGGQLTTTREIENFPGFATPLSTSVLMETMRAQAERFGANLVSDSILRADFSSSPFVCYGEEGTYTADAAIIATGAMVRWLDIPGEERLRGAGVSACATCDGAFFRNKTVAVVGGGNTAVDEALFLARLACKVYLIHRRDTLRAEVIQQNRLFACEKITCLWNKRVVSCQGEKRLESIVLEDVQTGLSEELPLEGLFVAVGHTPSTEAFKGQVALTPDGYIATTLGRTDTSVPGVFAAGDVCDSVYKQAITAAGQGCMAALDAERWLSGKKDLS
jgi:thioredoxin reductase (NADPH)